MWLDRRGRPARWPDLVEATGLRTTRVVLATAHLDGDPTNNRLTNLRALCQRCHMLHDRPQHLAQRWITYRRRRALGDLFLGPYGVLLTALRSAWRTTLADDRRHVSNHAVIVTRVPLRSRQNAARLTPNDTCPMIAFSPPLLNRRKAAQDQVPDRARAAQQ
jgi:hypothetical protein